MVLNQEQFDAFRMEIATFANIPIPQYWLRIGMLPNVAISMRNASNCS